MTTETVLRATEVLRQQFQEFHEALEAAIADVTNEQAHWTPPGSANPIGATYAHVVLSEDMGIHALLQGKPTLSSGARAERLGLSSTAPMGGSAGWGDWARAVRVDLDALRRYASAVYSATDAYLAGATDADLTRALDLSALGFGQPAARWVLDMALQNVAMHCGEIACLKGLQGLQGYRTS